MTKTAHANSTKQSRTLVPTQIIEYLLAHEHELDVYRNAAGQTFFAVTEADGSVSHEQVDSERVRQYLAYNIAYKQLHLTCTRFDLEAVTGWLGGHAMMTGRIREQFVRLAPASAPDGGFYLDLGQGPRTVHVHSDGWTILNHQPVAFCRPHGFLPLPEPVPGGSLSELRAFLHTASEDDWHRLVAFLLSTLMPEGDYPLLVLNGPSGAGKSTMTRWLVNLVDPTTGPALNKPGGWEDVLLHASHRWVVAYDNLSTIPKWLSDTLCRLSTGLGASRRRLYTNNDVLLYALKRPVILNGINRLVTADDLLSRSVRVTFPARTSLTNEVGSQLEQRFEAARPHILGALLDAASAAVRNREAAMQQVRAEHGGYPRLGDWTVWVVAAESALGWAPGTAYRVLTENACELARESLDTDLVTETLLRFMQEQPTDADGAHIWQGTTQQLWTAQCEYARKFANIRASDSGWPQSYYSFVQKLATREGDLRDARLTMEATQVGPKTHRVRGKLVRFVEPGEPAELGQEDDDESEGTAEADPRVALDAESNGAEDEEGATAARNVTGEAA